MELGSLELTEMPGGHANVPVKVQHWEVETQSKLAHKTTYISGL